MIDDKAELFDPLRSRYQIDLEQSIKGSNSIFDCVDLLHYKRHKIYLNRSETYLLSPLLIKNKKATTNSINMQDHKRFQCTATLALNHKEIGKIQKEYQN